MTDSRATSVLVVPLATLFALALGIAPGGPASAQTRLPSIYDPGCSGALCMGDARTQAGPPPPCQGLLCGMTPYSMERPVTAADAQRMQQERAAAEAAAAAAPPPKAKRAARHAKATKKTRAAAVARTPAPAEPGAAPAAPQ